MNRFYQLLVLILLLPVLVRAQQAGETPQVMSLDQCISYALENSVNIKNSVFDEKIAGAKVKETRGLGLPQISGTVQLTHNEKLQRFFTTYNPSGGIIDLSSVPGIQAGDVVAAQNFFQLKSSGNASVTANQQLFNSAYFVGMKAAKTYRELAVKNTQQSQVQAIQNVSKAYYACLINRDRMQLFDNNIARVDSLLKNTKALNKNGFAEGIDVDRIKVTLNNLIVERDKFYNLQELSLELLKFQMNYPMEKNLEVSGNISSLHVDESLLNNYALDWDYRQRVEYSILESNRRLQELNLKANYSSAVPSLSAFATLGYSTQSADIAGLFKTNTQIADYGAVGPDKWYSYAMYGVTLNVPLFGGFQNTYRVQQSKYSLLKAENNIVNLKQSIDLEVKQAATNYLNAVKSLKSQEENKSLAENIARITKIKYEQGVGSNIEVIEAESSLKEAQVNYYNSLYDAVIAKIDLDKAYGKLTPQTTSETK